MIETELVRLIRTALEASAAELGVAKAEVAGPGFINFFVTHTWLYSVLEEVRGLGPDFPRVAVGGGERVQVEFVSANPTGPLHVGSGRGAALGDALARVLEFTGYVVEREYYVNDAGSQMELFARSIEARYLERFGRKADVPEGGYHGVYIRELAEAFAGADGEALVELSPEDRRGPPGGGGGGPGPAGLPAAAGGV